MLLAILGAWSVAPAVAQANSTITISTGATSGVSFSGGTYTADNGVAVGTLNVNELVTELDTTDVTVDSTNASAVGGAGNIQVNTAIVDDSANVHNLTLNANDEVTLSSDIDLGTAASLSVVAPVISLATATVHAGTNVGFSGPVSLASDSSVTSADTSVGVIDGAHDLTLQGSSNLTIAGPIGATTALTSLSASGPTNLLGGAVTTTGAQTYNGAATLGANTTLTSTGSGNLTMGSTLDGAFSLTANTSGTTTFGGAIGGTTALTSLTTDFGGSTAVNGGGATTTGGQSYDDAVTLGANATLTSTGSGNISLDRTVDGAHSLIANTAGTTTFDDQVGHTTALTTVTTDAAGSTALNGRNFTTTGAQTYNDAVTLGRDAFFSTPGTNVVTFNSTVDGAQPLDVEGAATFNGAVGAVTALRSLDTSGENIRLNGASVTTTGAQDYRGNTTLGANTTLTSTGAADITFHVALDGAFSLTANTAGTTTFSGDVGGRTALTSLTTNAGGSTVLRGVTTTGAQTYNDAAKLDSATIGGNIRLTSTGAGNLSFSSTLNDLSSGYSLTANTAGTTTFAGAVGGTTALSSLTTDAAGSTALNGGSVTTTGAQTYNDAATLGANTTLTGSGNLTIGSTLNGAFSLTANTSGTTTFGGAIGGTTALTSLTTNAGGSTAVNGGGATTTGGQSYNDAATLGANTTLASTGGGNISFNSTLNGANALTANTSGTTTFGGGVGGTTSLSSLITDAGGTTQVNGGTVSTSGSQTYNDPLTIGSDATMTSTSGSVTAASTVALGTNALTIVGAGILQSTVSGTGGLTKAGTGTLTLSGTNTYSGLTTVSVGTLAVNGSLDTGGAGVLVSSGGTLAGNGTTGDVSVMGTVSPGSSVGTLDTGDLVMNAGSPHYAVEIDSRGADRIDATGTAALGGSLDLSLLGSYVHTPGTSYTIVHAPGGVSGTFQGLPQGASIHSGGNRFTISYTATDVILTAGASPTLATTASGGVAAGGQIHDTATLAGGFNPGGQVTFKLYGPDDSNCSGTPVTTDTKGVSGNGSYQSSDVSPAHAGVYSWTADYTGDANNDPASSPCNAANESVTVSPASPTLLTNASSGVVVGGQIHDTATLAGGASPSGQITFELFGPDDSNCSGTPVTTDTKGVSGNGSYQSPDFSPTQPGVYRWTADYSGDADSNPASSSCNAANESVTVSASAPVLTTSASPGVVLGGSIHDTATLFGGSSPSGQITFNLYDRDDSTCTGTPIFTDTKAVSGNGSYPSADFTPTGIGTYRWTASYSGDATNSAGSTACNEGGESVTVSEPTPNAAPETTIGRFPMNPKRDHTHFRFRSSIAGSTFTCQLDTQDPEPCKSPQDYRELEAGRHKFRVFATSPQGVDDPTPAKARFRISD